MKETKYGNTHYWCFIPEEWNTNEIAIWKGPEGQEMIIARAINKYEAKTIVDGLLQHNNVEDKTQLSNKEIAFLDFCRSHLIEPYATMASNAILWNDKAAYENLKNKFPSIYTS